MFLPEHRKRPKGVADLLPWGALVAPGVVVNKDGSFLAGWRYRGPDVDAATPEELSTLSEHLNRSLSSLGGDWMVHVDAARGRAAAYPVDGAFPDAVTRLLDQERRQQYGTADRNFETRYTLVVTHMPPEEVTSRVLRVFVEGEERKKIDWGEQLRLFQQRLDDLEDLLSARLSVERFDSEALVRHLHFCLTGLDHPVRLDGPACYLDILLASQDLYGGFEPRIGRHLVAPIAITGFPAASFPGILDFLGRLALPYRFSSRWLPLDAEVAARHLRQFRMKWWQKRRGLMDLVLDVLSPQEQKRPFSNEDAVKMAEDANEAMTEAASLEVRFGYYTAVLVLMGEEARQLEEAVRQVLRELRNHGFAARREEVNALEAFLGSLPGHGYPNVRRPLLGTRNLADLLPMTSVWAGRDVNPSPLFPRDSPALLWAATSGSTPFRLNLHVSDVGHTLVIGPTGAGKSTLLGLLAAQWFRYPQAQVFTFDKGYSAMPLVLAAGGDHYDIAGDRVDHLSFYPLARIDDARERAWAAEWYWPYACFGCGG